MENQVSNVPVCRQMLRQFRYFAVGFAVLFAIVTFAAPRATAQGVTLQAGDIVVVNPALAPCNGNTCSVGGQGALVQLRVTTSGVAPLQTVITSNTSANLLPQPVGVILDPNDSNLLVTDRLTGIIRVNPFTGSQTPLSSGGLFKDPFAVTLDNLGQIWVADSGLRGTCDSNGNNCQFQVNAPGQIILVNRTTGSQGATAFASGGFISHPYGIAYDPIIDMLYVSSFNNDAGTGSIVALDPHSGHQTLIWGTAAQCAASGNPNCVPQTPVIVNGSAVSLACPMGLTVDRSENILATTFNVPPYGCSNAGIFRVNLTTHQQENLQSNPPTGWRIPFGIDTEADGSILVVDEGFGAVYHLTSNGAFIDPVPFATGGLLATLGGGGPNALTVVRFTPTPHTGNTTTLTINGAPAGSPEGTAINLTSTVNPAGSYNYSWTVSKDGSPFTSGSGNALTFTPSDNGVYGVTLSIGFATAGTTISVTNVAPTITGISGPSAAVAAGSPVTISVNFTDPGTLDSHTCAFTWNDGSPASAGSVSEASGSGSCTGTHVFIAGGVYPVSATVTDKDGGTATGNLAGVTVVNSSPLASLSASTFTFSQQQLGIASTPQSFTLSNIGNSPLIITNVAINGDFLLSSNSCGGATLLAAASCTVAAVFKPTGLGARTGTITFTDNSGGVAGSTQTINLNGTGVAFSPNMLNYAAYASGTGCGAMILAAGSYTDSFNSSLGTYSHTKQLSNGNVGVNGNIIVASSTVNGTISALNTTVGLCSNGSPGITLAGGGKATGGYVQLSSAPAFPAPVAVTAGTQDRIVSVNSSLAPGSYHNIIVSGGATLTLSPGVYNVNSLILIGGSILSINGTGQVVLNIAGGNTALPLDLSGGSIANPSGIALNLQIIYGGNLPIILTGGSSAYALVYAPGALATFVGSSAWFGAITVKNLILVGSSPIHYDLALKP